ncbi:hypothetical protein TNCT_693571 [Trichonephila clavata]|uniref:Uncharacterized protein n=1 Tax=Trichonephila clavata TaxID=2740835 RepID=A0A8X6HK20_TRICU|nr:hypothetical protein TNCT_693571 [Trichonephila clavata]
MTKKPVLLVCKWRNLATKVQFYGVHQCNFCRCFGHSKTIDPCAHHIDSAFDCTFSQPVFDMQSVIGTLITISRTKGTNTGPLTKRSHQWLWARSFKENKTCFRREKSLIKTSRKRLFKNVSSFTVE